MQFGLSCHSNFVGNHTTLYFNSQAPEEALAPQFSYLVGPWNVKLSFNGELQHFYRDNIEKQIVLRIGD